MIPNSIRAILEANRQTLESIQATILPAQQMIDNVLKHQDITRYMQNIIMPPKYIADMLARQEALTDRMLKLAAPSKYIKNMQKSMEEWQRMEASLSKTFKLFTIPVRTSELLRGFLKPSLNVQNIIDSISGFSKYEDTLTSLTENLGDFTPSLAIADDSLDIEGEIFSKEDIEQIIEEYICDKNSDKNIFKQDSKYLSHVSKAVLWLISIVLGFYILAIWKEATMNTALSPETVSKRLVHGCKQEVRQIDKNLQNKIHPPFVNTEKLHVYTSPTKKCHSITVLSYLDEIEIVKFRHKKRWALIQWEDGSGEEQRGWVLGRYVYRGK